jgi:uncharacterized protein
VVALFDEGLELLTESQCLERLGRVRIGRVAVSIGALPAVFPVNFVFLDGNVYFLTGEGTKLRAATQGAVVAFEVDEFDPSTDLGWSVLVVGRATEVGDTATRSRVVAGGLRTSAGGDRSHLVRLATEFVSGRAIDPGSPSS